jgi:hypothetical protein
MTATPGPPLAALRRIAGAASGRSAAEPAAKQPRPIGPAGSRRPPSDVETCDMCGEPVADGHRHVVDLRSRALMCTCRACFLLFSDPAAEQRYRAIPDRYLSFPRFTLDQARWDELQIPVGLVFLFTNSTVDRTVAFYPGPAGATESELPLDAWEAIVAANPDLRVLAPDVEALLIRGPGGLFGRDPAGFDCHLVPVDACYELVGLLRRAWRGFDGGQEARTVLSTFFATVTARSKPA